MRPSLSLAAATLLAALASTAPAQESDSPTQVAPVTTAALSGQQLLELWSKATGRSVRAVAGFAAQKRHVAVRGLVTAEQIEAALTAQGTFLVEINDEVVATARWKVAQLLAAQPAQAVRADGKDWPQSRFAYVSLRLPLSPAEAKAIHAMAKQDPFSTHHFVTATPGPEGLEVVGRAQDVRAVLDWTQLFKSGPAPPHVKVFRLDAKTWTPLSAAPAEHVERALAKAKPLAQAPAAAGTDLTGNLPGLGPFSLQISRDPTQPAGSPNEFDFTLVSPQGTVSMRLHVTQGVVARTLPDHTQLVILVR